MLDFLLTVPIAAFRFLRSETREGGETPHHQVWSKQHPGLHLQNQALSEIFMPLRMPQSRKKDQKKKIHHRDYIAQQRKVNVCRNTVNSTPNRKWIFILGGTEFQQTNSLYGRGWEYCNKGNEGRVNIARDPCGQHGSWASYRSSH